MSAIDGADIQLSDQEPTHDRRMRFVEEYMSNGFDAGRAYQAAYPDSSPAAARSHAGRILTDPMVKELIERGREAAYRRIGISHERILQEIQRLAFVDESQFYDEHGQLRMIHDIPEDARRAIQGVKVDREGCRVGYEIEGKKGALELLAKISNMVVERTEAKTTSEVTVKASPEIEERIQLLMSRIADAEVFK